jgi:hypothetical protein
MARFSTVDHDLETLMTAAAAGKAWRLLKDEHGPGWRIQPAPQDSRIAATARTAVNGGYSRCERRDGTGKPSETAKQLAHRLANDARENGKAWAGCEKSSKHLGATILSTTPSPRQTLLRYDLHGGPNMEDAAVWQQAAMFLHRSAQDGIDFYSHRRRSSNGSMCFAGAFRRTTRGQSSRAQQEHMTRSAIFSILAIWPYKRWEMNH